jgi:hypothetical protein
LEHSHANNHGIHGKPKHEKFINENDKPALMPENDESGFK